MSESNLPAIDLAHLAQYTGDDQELERQILEMFVPNAMRYVEQLDDMPDAVLWHQAAHSLKGVARGVGAFALGDLAEALEDMHDATDSERREAVAGLREELRRVESFVASRLSR